MTKPIVLLIHGMGTHTAQSTTDEFLTGIQESSQYLGFPFDKDKLEIVTFDYSKKLDDIRNDIKEHSDNQTSVLNILQAAGGPAEIVGDLVSWQSDFGNDEFVYTHLLDVALYALTYHGVEIAISLAEKVRALMNKADDNNVEFHVIAHSLGTKVVNDALLRLFKEGEGLHDADQIDPFARNLDSLWMIANVSKLVGILDNMPNPDSTIISDESSDNRHGVADAMYNARNKFDPFTWVKTYERVPSRGRNFYFDDIRKLEGDLPLNPHSLTEYMAYPEIAREFIRKVFKTNINSDSFNAAMQAYQATTIDNMAKQKLEDVVNSISIDFEEGMSISQKVTAIRKSIEAIKKISHQMTEFL